MRGQFPVPMHTKDGVRALHAQLISLARNDASPTVRNQLACTVKRLPGKEALPILRELMQRDEDVNDPQIPLLVWWALESKAVSDRQEILKLFASPTPWHRPLVQHHILERILRRYAVEGTDEGFDACAQLLTLAPTSDDVERLLKGMELALEGRRLAAVPAALEDDDP